MVQEKYNVIFFTGAGISVESGIPTFQEQPGIRDKLEREWANTHPDEYTELIKQMVETCNKAEPNAAHKAIAAAGFPVITMNIDRLHTRAGSENVVEVHGVLPTNEEMEDEMFPASYDGIVLYGDMAPRYMEAIRMVKNLEYDNSYFVIVGTSFYTGISADLHRIAKQRMAHIAIINDHATEKVPVICESIKRILEQERKMANEMERDKI